MRRIVRVIRPAASDAARLTGSVMLGADQRRIQTGQLTAANGTAIGFMLPEPVLLRMGDALELDDGSLIEVVIEPEPLIEARGKDVTHLARLAWHLGDRHVPVQIMTNRLRLRRDAALEAMLTGLGARLTPIEAPFDPEGGAYATSQVHDHHGHDHGHRGHDHGHHGHEHHHHDHGHHHHEHCGHPQHGHDHDHAHDQDHPHGHAQGHAHRHD
jgi:urease accessory protein